MKASKKHLKSVASWFKKLSIKQIVIGVIVILLIILIAERLINQGTFLGYTVRDQQRTETFNMPEEENKSSFACSTASVNKVSDALQAEVVKVGGSYKDVVEPRLVSVCNYTTKQKPARAVTIVVKDLRDDDSASQSLSSTKNKSNVKQLEINDESYFAVDSRQLVTRKGNRVISVTVSEPREVSNIDSQQVTEQIAKLF